MAVARVTIDALQEQVSKDRSRGRHTSVFWNMEQYFIAARIPVGEQVTITTMYLTSDAKLWWRTRSSDDAAVG